MPVVTGHTVHGSFPQSHFRRARKLRLTSEAQEVRSYIGWDLFPALAGTLFSSSSVRVLWVPGHNNPDMTFIYFATVMALHFILITEVEVNS